MTEQMQKLIAEWGEDCLRDEMLQYNTEPYFRLAAAVEALERERQAFLDALVEATGKLPLEERLKPATGEKTMSLVGLIEKEWLREATLVLVSAPVS